MEGNLAPTLLLTRPRDAAERFRAELRAAGVDLPAVLSPVLKIVALPMTSARAGGWIFTSEHGVTASGASPEPAWVVGARTAAAARRAGHRVMHVASDADALVEHLQAAPPAISLLHLRGEHGRGDVAGRLARAGLDVGERVVYRQDEEPLTDAALTLLAGRAPVILPLFSPRSAALVARQSGPPVAPCRIVALSPAVASAWPHGGETVIAREKTGRAMLEATIAAAGA